MPPKQSGDSAAYKQLKQDIAAGTIGRLYVFHGEEAYLRDYYLGQMKAKLVPAGLEEFNLHTVQGRDCDPKRLAQEIDALPMMSPRTMVLVYDYDLFKAPAGDKEALTALFTRSALVIQKRTKRKDLADVDIAPMIQKVHFLSGAHAVTGTVVVQAQNPGLNPQLLEKAIAAHLPALTPNFTRIRRRELLDASGNIFR